MNRLKFSAFCLVAAALIGCATERIGDPYFADTESKANVYVGTPQVKALKIAVLPFKASTELIGSSVSDMIVTELLRTRKYSLVERSQMANVLSESELALAGLSETKAVEVAKLMGAEAVVIGTVDEYGTQAKGGDTYAVVGLSIRLIDCANGRVVWSADLAEIARRDDTPLAQHARDVVHELVAGLYQKLVEQELLLPLPPPTGVVVSEMGLREATLSWNRNADAVKLRIERAASETGPFVQIAEVPGAVTTYRDRAGLADGAVYYYRLHFVNRKNVAGTPSESVETMTAPPPDAPGALAAAAPSSRCVELRWTAPRSEGVTGYRVERAAAGSESWQSLGTVGGTSFRDGGVAGCDLADSARYVYRVAAVNRVGAVGEAAQSAPVETLPPPAAVAGFTAPSREIRCVPLSWQANAEPDVVGYAVECADGDGAFKPLETVKGRDSVRFLHGDADPGDLPDEHSFRYRIRAFNAVGSFSVWSEAAAVTKPAPKVPAEVKTTTDLAGKVRLSWAKNPEPDIVEYRVEALGMGGMFWSKVATTSECAVEEPGLKPGEKRTYRVMAVGPKNHQSAWSPEVTGTARPLPPAPTGLAARKTDRGYEVSFTSPKAEMTGYRIYRKKLVGADLLAEGKEPSFALGAETVGEKGVDVVVTAIDACGLESEPSEKLSVR